MKFDVIMLFLMSVYLNHFLSSSSDTERLKLIMQMFELLLGCFRKFNGIFVSIQVVHPAPGNATGTLVSGILHHCSLPTVSYPGEEVLSDVEDASDDELTVFSANQSPNVDDYSVMCESYVRPGIVHRLDKGTSGLLVVAKVIPTYRL